MDQAAVLSELKVNLGLPWEKLVQRLGLTKQRVLDLVCLLDLPDEIKEVIRQKKLTEKHGRALRQLLDQAEVLREVVNFMKEKKLTGDQSLELVREVKSKPGFTVEDSYKEISVFKKKNTGISKNSINVVNYANERLLKLLLTIKKNNISLEDRAELKDKLNKTLDIIKKFIKKL